MADTAAKRSSSWWVAGLPLNLLVLYCGAALMTLEIAGARMLAPFFGSSVFVWGGVISVFMASLAAGYYIGGRTSDKYPRFTLLAVVVATAGLAFLILPLLSLPLCTWIRDMQLGMKWGPLLAAAALFAVPSVLLAMVAPFSIKLSAESLAGVGNVAGKLYALSTVGSILGTLGTTFVFIPAFTTHGIIIFAGVLLPVVSGFCWWLDRRAAGKKAGAGVPAVFLVVTAALAAPGIMGLNSPPAVLTNPWDADEPHRLVDWKDTPYHLIIITEQDHVESGGRTRRRRVLRFNEHVQSAIWTDKEEEDGSMDYEDFKPAVGYTALFHLAFIFNPDPKNILFVGMGGGIGPTEFRHHYGMDVDVVDIDPEIEWAARKYFHLHPEVKVHIDDGRRFLENVDDKYDVIVLDAYSSAGSIPFQLLTREFLELVKSRLTESGVVISNIISALEGKGSELFQSEYETFVAAGFERESLYVFPRFGTKEERKHWSRAQRGSKEPMNIEIIAAPGRKLSRTEIIARAESIASRKERPVPVKDFTLYAHDLWKPKKLERAIILTDIYAPVETMFHGY